MARKKKKLSNPTSTGGAGSHFEAYVQSSFVAMMLSGGYAPCLPCWPIKEIKPQGKVDGYDTDDLIVHVENNRTGERRKLLGQIKRSIAFTKGSSILEEVICAAWSDFNNSVIFKRGKDVIALITGPLSSTDQQNVQWLLDHAKQTKDSNEFFRHVNTANFSPAKSGEKLDAFKHHLKTANNEIDVSDEDIYLFFNSFHVLDYDLSETTGAFTSLLHSHIGLFERESPHWVWPRIITVVQLWNSHAGTITREDLPEDLLNAFSEEVHLETIPEELKIVGALEQKNTDWRHHKYSSVLSLTILIGSWDEKNKNDVAILCKLLNMDYSAWLPQAREILLLHDSPLSLKNGTWTITNKEVLLGIVGSQILDQDLDHFREVAQEVLKEKDPAFDLPKDQRYAASIHGNVLQHSYVLRQGITEGLALLGSSPQLLENCSLSKAENIPLFVIRGILDDATWQQWGTLNNLLPNLAEAAPNEFLDQLDKALVSETCPFDEIFAQEGNGATGSNYITGLLWALESLAWDEKNLVRVCCTLAELSLHDPGGQWANRPINSIITILLPWLPQTLASVEKHEVAINSICIDNPDIGWKVRLELLPSHHQTSMGTHKPRWRKFIPDDFEKGVSDKEYREQIITYAKATVEMAGTDFERVLALIGHLSQLPSDSFDLFIVNLSSDSIQQLSEKNKQVIWESLVKFTSKHRRFSDSDWTLPKEKLMQVEGIAESLAPNDPLYLYQYLFSNRELDLYEERGNWKEQREKIAEKRQDAIAELLASQELNGVIDLARSVTLPLEVGHALGAIGNYEIDKTLMSDFLLSEEKAIKSFVSAYLWRRRYINGWEWADSIRPIIEVKEQAAQFLSYLPFEKNAWDRVEEWLEADEVEYWKCTAASPYNVNENIEYAIEKLLQYNRPSATIECLWAIHSSKGTFNSEQCIQALLAVATTTEEQSSSFDHYQLSELIKALQADASVNEEGLFQVEWLYLSLLIDGYHDVSPTLLEAKLANDPQFFCELIQLMYRSKNDGEQKREGTESEKNIATQAWKLLYNWKTPPGTDRNENFNPANFDNWLQSVKEICLASGHLDIALLTIGGVLIYADKDDSDLWINSTIANALNAKDAGDMRSGYCTATFNSRGVHWVDPTGAPEKELEAQFNEKADAVENHGYHRFAVTLREIADDYRRHAERVIDEHKKDD